MFRRATVALAIALSSCGVREVPTKKTHWVAGPNVGTLDLLGVCYIEPGTAWAVGDIDLRGAGGAIYKTTDGGATWTAISRANEVLTSIHFANPLTGWVAGYAGTIERTDDGGTSWKAQRTEQTGEVL
ncbi:MAG TPA: hypothetical protein VN345_00300, partial [Blastocatellia bacterium]|nr:hypothetical protein [Blastocatellia bacterium]